MHYGNELGERRMSDSMPTQTFPDGAKVKIQTLNLVGRISGFAHVGVNGQMRVLVDRPHGQGILRQHFDECDLELVVEP